MNVLVVLQTFFCADIPGHIEPHLRVDGGLELQDCTMIMSSTFKSCRTADVPSLLKQVLELNTLAGAQDLLFPRCQEETLRLLASAGRACSSCSMLGELIAAMIAAFTKLLSFCILNLPIKSGVLSSTSAHQLADFAKESSKLPKPNTPPLSPHPVAGRWRQ